MHLPSPCAGQLLQAASSLSAQTPVVLPSDPLPSRFPREAAPLLHSVWIELAPQLQEEPLTQSLLTAPSRPPHGDWLRDEHMTKVNPTRGYSGTQGNSFLGGSGGAEKRCESGAVGGAGRGERGLRPSSSGIPRMRSPWHLEPTTPEVGSTPSQLL